MGAIFGREAGCVPEDMDGSGWESVLERLDKRRQSAYESVYADDVAWLEGESKQQSEDGAIVQATDENLDPEAEREAELERRLKQWLKQRAAQALERDAASSDEEEDSASDGHTLPPYALENRPYPHYRDQPASASLHASPGTPPMFVSPSARTASLPAKPPMTPLHARRSLALHDSFDAGATAHPRAQRQYAQHEPSTGPDASSPAHSLGRHQAPGGSYDCAMTGLLSGMVAAREMQRHMQHHAPHVEHTLPSCSTHQTFADSKEKERVFHIAALPRMVLGWFGSRRWDVILENLAAASTGFLATSLIVSAVFRCENAFSALSSMLSMLTHQVQACFGDAHDGMSASAWKKLYVEAKHREQALSEELESAVRDKERAMRLLEHCLHSEHGNGG